MLRTTSATAATAASSYRRCWVWLLQRREGKGVDDAASLLRAKLPARANNKQLTVDRRSSSNMIMSINRC
eukprot:COSAG06_NODE_4535_length_4168_cov_3.593512_6_plen_70_part_00